MGRKKSNKPKEAIPGAPESPERDRAKENRVAAPRRERGSAYNSSVTNPNLQRYTPPPPFPKHTIGEYIYDEAEVIYGNPDFPRCYRKDYLFSVNGNFAINSAGITDEDTLSLIDYEFGFPMRVMQEAYPQWVAMAKGMGYNHTPAELTYVETAFHNRFTMWTAMQANVLIFLSLINMMNYNPGFAAWSGVLPKYKTRLEVLNGQLGTVRVPRIFRLMADEMRVIEALTPTMPPLVRFYFPLFEGWTYDKYTNASHVLDFSDDDLVADILKHYEDWIKLFTNTAATGYTELNLSGVLAAYVGTDQLAIDSIMQHLNLGEQGIMQPQALQFGAQIWHDEWDRPLLLLEDDGVGDDDWRGYTGQDSGASAKLYRSGRFGPPTIRDLLPIGRPLGFYSNNSNWDISSVLIAYGTLLEGSVQSDDDWTVGLFESKYTREDGWVEMTDFESAYDASSHSVVTRLVDSGYLDAANVSLPRMKEVDSENSWPTNLTTWQFFQPQRDPMIEYGRLLAADFGIPHVFE